MNKKILVVDNNKVILKFLTHMLQKMGHEVKTAEDGLSALEVLKSYLPDAMFIDLIMPNIGGDTLCRIIRKKPELDSIFLAIISAVAVEEQIDFAGFGADACIAKGPAKEMEKHITTVLAHTEKKELHPLKGEILGAQDVYGREVTKELLATKKHFEITLENMGDGFLELTWSGKIIFVNSTATALFNSSEEKILSSNFLDNFEENQRDNIANYFDQLRQAPVEIGEDSPIEVNGKYVLLKFVPIDEQEQKSIIVLMKDITQRKFAEQKLHEHMSHLEQVVAERTEKYNKINKKLQEKIVEGLRTNDKLEYSTRQWSNTFDAISDFVSVHDKDMRFLRVNKALATYVGKEPEELIGRYCYEVMHNRKSPWPNCPHVKAIEKNEVITEEIDDPHIGIPLLVTCSPFFHDDGSLLGSVHIARNISQQKKSENEREALIAKLQEALSKVKQLSGIIPICASCKQVRDDKGFWNQVEMYIRDHSEAEFSHSICPKCAKKLYPEEYEAICREDKENSSNKG